MGLIPGFRVVLNNVVKIISKKGNGYLTSTVFTNIQLVDVHDKTERNNLKTSEQEGQDSCMKPMIWHLSEVKNNRKVNLNVYRSYLTLETVYKVSISTICEACHSKVAIGKNCQFVGCHVPIFERKVNFICSAVLYMEDETYGANIHVKDLSVLRKIFCMISEDEWNLILKAAEHRGEILFLNKKQKFQENFDENVDPFFRVQTCFTILCEVYPITYYNRYLCKLRPLFNDKTDNVFWNDDQLNFICLDANQTDTVV